MTLSSALIAFLEAWGGGRSGPGPAPVTPEPHPAPSPPPLGQVLEALQVRVSGLEAELKGMKSYVDEETDRARRASEGARTALRRIQEQLAGSEDEPEPAPAIPTLNAPASYAGGVQPVYDSVDGAGLTEKERQALIRRQIAFM